MKICKILRTIRKLLQGKRRQLTHKEKYESFERNYLRWHWVRDVRGDVRHFFDTIERFFYWGWKLRHNYDWDSAGIYDMIIYKLDRMLPIFEGSDVHSYTPKFINKMKQVRELAKRLRQGDYSRNHDAFEAKWGSSNWNTYSANNGITKMLFVNPLSVNASNEDRYHEECGKALKADYADEVADRKLLFEMLNKNIQKWWD